MNVDGAVTNYGEVAGCGGVMRDEFGNFHGGFAARLDPGTITSTELWGIAKGLRLAQAKEARRVWVETDSMAAVKLVKGGCSPLHPCYNLVKDIQELMAQLGECLLSRTFREENQVADGTAKFGMGAELGDIFFDRLPSFVSSAFAADCMGTFFPRGF